MDAVLDEPCWAEDPGVVPSERAENGRVRIRYDARNLYFAYDEPPVTDKKERPAGKAAAKEHPGAAWAENGFDVVLKDSTYPLAAQFAVSPGGAKYAAEISYSVDVPKAENIQVDGKADDWGKQGVVLSLAEGRGSVRLAWCPEGLLVLTTLPKDFFSYEKAWTSLREQLVNAASPAILETVLDAASQSVESVEAVIEPKLDSARHDLNMYRPSRKLEMKTASARTEDALVAEALFPLEKLGLKAGPSTRLGLKLVAYNPKAVDPNITSGAGSRRAALTDGILQALHLTDGAPRTVEVKCVSARREWYGSVMVFAPPAYHLPPDSWSGASVEQAGLRTEMTIPIRALNELGLSADRLLALLKTPGKMEPDVGALAREFGQARRVHLSKAEWKAGTYTVRLHFAELAEIKPGERVFGVKLQGKTVLEALDVAKEAGGQDRAVVKTFPGVAAGKVMDIEFCPKAEALNENTLPILNGIELIAEER
jgi:hypothetical protein